MKIKPIYKILCLGILVCSTFISFGVFAQNVVNINAQSLVPKANISISPHTATFQQGAKFDVSFFINTNKNSINSIDLRIKFDANKLMIASPSAGKSIIGVWPQPPVYSNTQGTAKLVGIVPGGINTESGLITTITFQAISSGEATVEINPSSQILLNDGMGTQVDAQYERGTYMIVPVPPAGPKVFSETHPFSDVWYNNNNPVFSWDKLSGVTDFSFELDDKPFTIPDNISDSKEAIKAYNNLKDGLWYFHIKALKNKIWGSASHFLVRIDTTPPAEFTPVIDSFLTTISSRALISFFTTDDLSGVDHYEVGVLNKSNSLTESPAFIPAESFYLLPLNVSGTYKVIVRAFDKAHNVRDESIELQSSGLVWLFLWQTIKSNSTAILFVVLIILLGISVFWLFRKHALVKRQKEEIEKKHAEFLTNSNRDKIDNNI